MNILADRMLRGAAIGAVTGLFVKTVLTDGKKHFVHMRSALGRR